MSDSVRPHRRQPTRLPCPWDFPGGSTGVGCHCLLWNLHNRKVLIQQFSHFNCSQHHLENLQGFWLRSGMSLRNLVTNKFLGETDATGNTLRKPLLWQLWCRRIVSLYYPLIRRLAMHLRIWKISGKMCIHPTWGTCECDVHWRLRSLLKCDPKLHLIFQMHV